MNFGKENLIHGKKCKKDRESDDTGRKGRHVFRQGFLASEVGGTSGNSGSDGYRRASRTEKAGGKCRSSGNQRSEERLVAKESGGRIRTGAVGTRATRTG